MAGRMHIEWSELDHISVELKASLNIPNLRPFLRAKHLLTESELEQVDISPVNPRDKAIDKFVSILKTKGPNHAEVFLEVLKESLEQEDSHLGHVHLSERLGAAIQEKIDMELQTEAVGPIPVPAQIPQRTPVRCLDSGLGGQYPGSGSSSQESGSPGSSLLSGSSSFHSEVDEHARNSILIHGLEKLDKHRFGLDERQVSILRHKITNDTLHITSRFAVMVVGVYRLLKKNNVPVDEVTLMLRYLGCHPGKPPSENTKLFSESDEISEAKDLQSLIECLRKYSSWYNYHLMKVVAEEFAGDEGKKLIFDYEDDLRKHYTTLIAYQCPDFSLDKGIPPGYTKLIVKVDWEYATTDLERITTFQSSLANILELEPYVFQLRSVEEGCVRFDWSIPSALEPHLSNMMIEKEDCLRELSVLYLEMASAGKVVIETHAPHKVETYGSLYSASPKKTTLSASSSIVSVLDVPMSMVEAELLSIYDSSASVDGGSLSSVHLPTTEDSTDILFQCMHQDEAESDQCGGCHIRSSPSAADLTDLTPTGINDSTTTARIRRGYYSEGNLLETSPLISKKEGRSLPDIAGDNETTPQQNRCSCTMRRHRSIMKSLKNIPRNIFRRLRRPLRGNREERCEWACPGSPTLWPAQPAPSQPAPFPVLELNDEPKKPGNCPEGVALYDYAVPPVEVDQPPLLAVNNDEERRRFVVTTVPLADLDRSVTPTSRRDSAISLAQSLVSPAPMHSLYPASRTDRKYRDSGVDSAFSSLTSSQCSRRQSTDSVDTVSSCSASQSFKRNSYNTHHYVTHAYPIYEDPADDVTTRNKVTAGHKPPHDTATLPRYPPMSPHALEQDGTLPSENNGVYIRGRSHSHDEGYYHQIKQNRISSPHSSGYSSMASSMAQVDAVDQLQESLDGGGKLALSTHSYRFPSQPAHPGRVRRGGSLTSAQLSSTGSRGGPPHHFQSHQLGKRFTD
jgi:hypothetical protein